MAWSRRSAVGLVMMNALYAALPEGARPQQVPMRDPATNRDLPSLDNGRNAEDPITSEMHERMRISAEKAANNDRRKRMLADTDKLLALSTELKADIEKSNKDELSMEVIRKAAEIEKLAHDVQQRMRG